MKIRENVEVKGERKEEERRQMHSYEICDILYRKK
jgi:hypothetical protein